MFFETSAKDETDKTKLRNGAMVSNEDKAGAEALWSKMEKNTDKIAI